MSNNTVKLAVYGNPAVEIEGKLLAAVGTDVVRPGLLMERVDSGSGTIAYRPHSTAEGKAAKLIVVENIYFGKGIDDYYKSAATPLDDKVYMIYARPGDVVWCLLPASQVITIGMYLYSNGSGYVMQSVGTPTEGSIIGSSLENISTGVGVVKHIKVEIV